MLWDDNIWLKGLLIVEVKLLHKLLDANLFKMADKHSQSEDLTHLFIY